MRRLFPAAQQQGIGQDTDTTEGHCASRNHWIEQAESRQRYADQVVNHCPEKILSDLGIGMAGDIERIAYQ